MIIRGGEDIYPREIEAVLAEYPGVADAAVLGIPDTQWGEIVAAVIQPRDEHAPPTSRDLYALVRARPAPAKTPQVWYVTTQLPVNAMGKLQKFRLRDRVLDGDLPALA